ncbi:DUF975 family protein [Bacillus cytotoxicus]|uniref:DUF975 domain-containing protein n=1 Tax=Bacillus cytotoxicus TaxID=580165 RepID=A0AAX2CN69_9BACI|nr:DUF975 family protein [Bacillus cytotoxicus]QTR84081.1 DUF975 family protein [Bacillus cytotoxicus]QTR87817.1 DUF975 family protein [Bacillus cytotoxicus]SCM06682.1 Uncharacterized protein BCB44BAC_04298 [Bacillus cytotoxicus]
MISEMKREALQSLKGKWGLGVGSTILQFVLSYIVSLVASLIIFIPAVLLIIATSDSLYAFEEGAVGIGAAIAFIFIYILMLIVNYGAYGIMVYGYTNLYINISKRNNVTIDYLFEGFRGLSRMWKSIKAMLGLLVYSLSWLPIVFIGILMFVNPPESEALVIVVFGLLFISIIVSIIAYFSYAMTFYILVENPEYSVLQALKESKSIMKGHKLDLFLLWLSFIGWGILAMFTLGIGLLWLYPYFTTTTAHFYRYISEKELY